MKVISRPNVTALQMNQTQIQSSHSTLSCLGLPVDLASVYVMQLSHQELFSLPASLLMDLLKSAYIQAVSYLNV